jgi:hypothetical protein
VRVFENGVLRRIFGPKRDEMIAIWRKLYDKEFHSLFSSTDIIIMIKSRRMGWRAHSMHRVYDK